MNTGREKKPIARIICIVLAVVLAAVLLIPIPVQWRSGTIEYKALTYSVYHCRRTYEEPQREGHVIKIFGIEVYNDWNTSYP